IHRRITDSVDRVKTESRDLPLIAVGGGSSLIPKEIPGISEVHHVRHASVANAVGAAIAQVSGEVDQVFQDMTREDALSLARSRAEAKAVQSGALAETLTVVELEDLPIAYLPGHAIRARVRVVGDLARD
ncbi:MAG: hydantoinase/oxoprolinase family protein, partial [Sneathiella sp.]